MNNVVNFGKLNDDDFETIRKELDPLFELEFERSSILNSYSQDKQPEVKNTRTSTSYFPKQDKIPNTIRIVKSLVSDIYGNEFGDMFTDVQLLKYDVGELFEWHFDFVPGTNPSRIITFSMNMNDEYEGVGLQIKYHKDKLALENTKGHYTAFLSTLMHKAFPPTKGQRRALTFWFIGDPKYMRSIQKVYEDEKRQRLQLMDIQSCN